MQRQPCLSHKRGLWVAAMPVLSPRSCVLCSGVRCFLGRNKPYTHRCSTGIIGQTKTADMTNAHVHMNARIYRYAHRYVCVGGGGGGATDYLRLVHQDLSLQRCHNHAGRGCGCCCCCCCRGYWRSPVVQGQIADQLAPCPKSPHTIRRFRLGVLGRVVLMYLLLHAYIFKAPAGPLACIRRFRLSLLDILVFVFFALHVYTQGACGLNVLMCALRPSCRRSVLYRLQSRAICAT